jgi:hypothetical protein
MKAHQQNTWKTFIFRSLDVCYASTVPQDQQASLLLPVELYWLRKGQKELKGSAQKDSFKHMKFVEPRQLLEAVQNALTQQGKSSAAIHHSLDEFDPGYLPFCLRI